jgi:hypothetical protein
MFAILRLIVAGSVLPAIAVHEPPNAVDHRYAVCEGFHRFYASAALGFTNVPVSVLPFTEPFVDVWPTSARRRRPPAE